MKKKYPTKQALITGGIVAIFGPVFFALADKLINSSTSHTTDPMTIRGITGLLSLIILGIGIYFGMQSIKKLNGGILTYGAAMKAGVFIAVVTGIITAAFTFIYCRYIDPDYVGHIISESIGIMVAEHKPSEEIASAIGSLTEQLSLSKQVIQALIGQSVSGTILSLIIAGFVSSKKK